MKKKHIINYIAIYFLLSACTLNEFDPQEWAIDPILELSSSGVVLSSLDESYSFTYETNYKEITITTNQPNWVSISLNKIDKTVFLNISSNEGVEQRTASIRLTVSRGNKSLSKEITIYQVGGKWDIVEDTDIKLRWSYDVSDSQKEVIKNLIRDLVYVEGGSFLMGTQNYDENMPNYLYFNNETNPLHTVALTNYYIGKYEITQEQWAAIMETSPSKYHGAKKPIENIQWEEAIEFVTRLSRLTGLNFSLPTSAQWEYAARGGRYSMGYSYPGSNDFNDVAHVISALTPINSPMHTTKEVGTLLPNELGLYDMAGNVSEMCTDWYGIIPEETQNDPTGPNSGEYHVERGGDFMDGSSIKIMGNCGYPKQCIVTSSTNVGFRIVMKK